MAKEKQTPMLMIGPITERVYVVTRWKPMKNPGQFEALEKFDIHDQFTAIANRLIQAGKLSQGMAQQHNE